MFATAESKLQTDEGFWEQAEAQFIEDTALDEAQRHVDAFSLAMWGLEQRISGRNEWLPVDQLPSARVLREQTDVNSKMLLAERQEQLNAGNFEAVPYAFDVLATGRKLVDAERIFGKASKEYKRILAGMQMDSVRHIAEARRRLTYEYFEPVEQYYDAEADSYTYGGYILKTMVDNGLSPVGSEDVGIEVLMANRREEYTSSAIGKLARLTLEHAGVKVEGRITMFTVSQVDSSPQTMIWAMRFDPQRGSRFQEQVAVTKDHITHEVFVEAYKRKGLLSPDAQPTETELLGIQALSFESGGVMGFLPLLDEIASERSGKNIFMGRVVDDDLVKDYSAIPAEAAARQAKQEDEARRLLDEILRLAKAGTDGWLANHMIDKFVTDMLLDKVAHDPAIAMDIFGSETAYTIQRSIWHRQRGDIDTADRLLSAAREEAPQATVCTGGSCGLETVDAQGKEGRELAAKLKAEPGDTIVKDKVRRCKCGKKSIVYAYNNKKVNKLCTNPNCEAFESKASSVKTG